MNSSSNLFKNQPKVSIVIPAYNAHKYLKEAIISALNQTYKNIEIIVVNDGSNDKGKTRKIAQSFGNKIKYFEKDNGGVSTALNLAISKMTGDFFSWLSHDDRYYPDKIETQINYLNTLSNNENVILYSDYDLMDKKSRVYAKSIKNHLELIQKPEYALLRGSINGITLLIPKKAFNECGVFDEKLRCTQDYELWERMQKKYTFVHQPELLATTRLHEKQQSNINPNMLSEGEPFWINLIAQTSLETMKRLEGTEYNFYHEMFIFLKTTPYIETTEFVNKKLEEIEKKCTQELEKIKVSIVIPFYNRITMLLSALNSVLAQTHKNLEVILINDGSTDNLAELLEFIKNDNKIKLFNLEKNCGPATARNLGMEKASGEYLAFLDSDDFFVENKIEVQLKQMVLTGSLFSHSSYIRRGFNSEIVINSGSLSGIVIPKIICSCGIATPTLMISRELYNKPEFRYDSSLKIGEDVCLYLSALNEIPVLGINEPLTIVNVGKDTCAYNYEKQQEGLKNIMQFILDNQELYKYDIEFCNLLREYIRVVNEKYYGDTYSEKSSKLGIKRFFYLLRRCFLLYRNDRPKLKRMVFYKLRNHPKTLNFLRKAVRVIKRILGKNHK